MLVIFHGEDNVCLSFSALLCAQVYPTQRWQCFTLDPLLEEGDELYLNALANGQIPNAETI